MEREDLSDSMVTEFIQSRPNVIEDAAIGNEFEDQSLLERVNDAYWNQRGHGQNVDEDADNTESHAERENAEMRRHLDNLKVAKLVVEDDMRGQLSTRIFGR
jgi:hypothetical protein